MFLPAYLLTSGLGSKLSRWLVPPIMKSQMTRFAFGAKWGLPSGGDQGSAESTAVGALAYPSRWSIAASARPVKPMPRSARNARRGKRRQEQSWGWVMVGCRLIVPTGGGICCGGARLPTPGQALRRPGWFSRSVHILRNHPGRRRACPGVGGGAVRLADRHKIIVVQQDVDEVLSGSLDGFVGWRDGRGFTLREGGQPGRVGQARGLIL